MGSLVLYSSVTGTSDVQSISIDRDYGQPTATAVIQAMSTSLGLGDHITVDIGYQGDHQQVFSGYVASIETARSAEGLIYTIRARDTLWRAVSYFIASDDPEVTLKYSNIAAEDLVKEMLEISGITSYSLDSPGFTFAPEEPYEVQVVSAWDVIARVCRLLAWHCYDDNGTVKFVNRKPYNVAGDVSSYTFTTGDSGQIISVQPHSESSDKIRNRVVVYGAKGIHATASANSPFLPSGFYKTEVIAAPDLIDTQQMADDIASYNLDLLNRLEKGATLQVAGVPSVDCRDVVTVTEAESGLSGDWFVYSIRYDLADTFTQTLTLTQRQTS